MQAHTVDLRALAASGIQALRGGEPARARDLLTQALALDAADPALWVNLALACRALDDADAELEALERALGADPRGLYPLLLKGSAWERKGDAKKAAEAFGAALQVAPPFAQLPAELRPAIRHAVEVTQKHAAEREAFLRERMAATYGKVSGALLSRFDQSFDVMLGKKAVYRPQPHVFYMPGLPSEQFYDDRSLFPWIEDLEAQTGVIQDELAAILSAGEGLTPYVQYPDGKPIDQWAQLNHNPDWSAFHFAYEGKAIEANVARCPRTVDILKGCDQAQMPGLSPAALFSVLKPRTHIPPHTGVTNARLLCHLPLILPADCRFRVGNDVRQWEMGHAFVFDDSIEHEAWNDSDQVRVVMIFDLWHPALSVAERELCGALFQGMVEFQKGAGFGE